MDPQQLPLKPIHQGAEIANWPIAPGWWILFALIISALVYCVYKLRQRKQRNKAKKLALIQLNLIQSHYQETQDGAQMLNQCAHLLKRFLMAYYPRSSVAKLHGEPFRTFLAAHIQQDETLKAQILGQEGETLTEGRYQAKVNASKEVFDMVEAWIKQFPTDVQQQNKMELPHARV